MTTLASYIFPPGSSLSNVVVRGCAGGRYLNNTGSNQNINVICLVGQTTLTNLTVPIGTSTAAMVWEINTHFYFTQTVVQTGTALSLGCILRVYLGNAGTSGGRTSSYVAALPFQASSLPLTRFIDTTAQVMLSFQFNPAGVAGETFESGFAYLEAL